MKQSLIEEIPILFEIDITDEDLEYLMENEDECNAFIEAL